MSKSVWGGMKSSINKTSNLNSFLEFEPYPTWIQVLGFNNTRSIHEALKVDDRAANGNALVKLAVEFGYC